jgi:hypothetical protein
MEGQKTASNASCIRGWVDVKNWSGPCEKENILPQPQLKIEPNNLQLPAHSLITILILRVIMALLLFRVEIRALILNFIQFLVHL